MPRHSGPRARITFSESAEKQIEALTDEAELPALDRALAVPSVDPDAGTPIPGSHPGLRNYRDDADDVHVIYFVTALRTIGRWRTSRRKAPALPRTALSQFNEQRSVDAVSWPCSGPWISGRTSSLRQAHSWVLESDRLAS